MGAAQTLELPPGIPATNSQTESKLLRALQQCSDAEKRIDLLWTLSQFYFYQAKRNDLATALLNSVSNKHSGNEQRAVFHLALGQIAQSEKQWDVALEHYAIGLSRSPRQPRTLYLLYNNSGYCQNMMGFHAEAKEYCRLAIAVDSNQHDAYKNLAWALKHQGDFKGAAWSLIEAMKLKPSNRDIARLLKELLTDHPELSLQCPWIMQELDAAATYTEN
jgi:tetratricopeptide (TPR) repeat protein